MVDVEEEKKKMIRTVYKVKTLNIFLIRTLYVPSGFSESMERLTDLEKIQRVTVYVFIFLIMLS